MNVEEVSNALSRSTDPDFAVVVLRKDRDRLVAAPVLGVALDDDSDDVALLMGAFSEEEQAFEGAASVGEIRTALEGVGVDGSRWPVFSTSMVDPTVGGSLVGYSVDDEIEVFAFLQGPKSDWETDPR